MQTHLKIGLIQNAPLTADFPNNLRSIIQGYRECLDHGAELVIAPATALCGPAPGALVERRSFLKQTQAALDALSHELGTAPLLLGAYAPLFPDDAEEWEMLSQGGGVDADELASNVTLDLVPFLIEKDSVTELAEAELTEICGVVAYIDICEGEVLPEVEEFDLLIHLCDSAWHTTAAHKEEESRLWEARHNHAPVVWAQAVGTAGSSIYAGGSGICTAKGKMLLRLPFFETANRVADIAGVPHARALPSAEELLEQALIRGIRDSVHQNGYHSVCLPLNHPHSPLLMALCVEALGSANVQGVTFGDGNDATEAAKALGITVEQLDCAPLLRAASTKPGTPLAERLQASLICTQAEEKGYMLLSPLGRHEIMLGQFTLYGNACGLLVPLGNLYRMDIHLLTKRMSERYTALAGTLAVPTQPEQDRIIHELADRNISASELLANHPALFAENDVRMVQRRLIASALKRAQLPTILHVDAPSERHTLPLTHRLND